MKRVSGFTLIEMMITVAIIGILAAIAYPSYTEYTMKSRRTEAKSCLMELAQFMERLYATNATYLDDGQAPTLPTLSCTTSLSGHYALSFSGTPTRTSYTLQAIPQGSQASKDTKCGTLTLNQAGAKTESGTGTVSDCW